MGGDLFLEAFVALLYGCAAFLATRLSAYVCSSIEPFEDGPQPGKPPTPWLIGGAAAIGLTLVLRDTPVPQLVLIAILVSALVAAWYSDVLTGIVPDYFTLVPLAAFLLLAALAHDYARVFAAFAVALPFGAAALLSRGRGMGWGDVKLAALGGVALGWTLSIPAFIGACVVAAGYALIRRRKHEPIAFAPYLAGAIGVALAFSSST
jgi:prepilin signal peptidase PulO-like enzyme (type II secretory pathway)